MTRYYRKTFLAQWLGLWLGLLALSFSFSSFAAGASSLSGIPKNSQTGATKYKDSWNFYLRPYLWFAGLSGHVNAQDTRATFTNHFSQLRQNLDFSLGGHFEANKGLWTLLLDSDYVKITQQPVINGSNALTTYETTMTDAGAYYRLYEKPVPRENYLRASFELLGAARIITAHSMLDTPSLNNPTVFSISDTSSVVVPLLGARLQYHFSPKWHTWLSGEVGGFQVSQVSSTWSASLGFSYNFSEHLDLSLAYKALALNYSIEVITINTLLQGPVLGLGYSW
jgi:hypothetical protein